MQLKEMQYHAKTRRPARKKFEEPFALKGRKKREYFAAVQAGMDQNYGPMEKIFREVINRTLRTPA
jgi:hypothetical protein